MNRKIIFTLWALGSLLFFVEYIVRVSPNILHNELVDHFNIGAFEFGIMASFFYYAYIIMQVPSGIIVDRFPTAKVLGISAIFVAAGIVMFPLSYNYHFAVFSRFIIGFCSSFAFVGTLKIISSGFSNKSFALFAGITQGMGMLGVIFGDGPLATIFSKLDWKYVYIFLAIIFLIIGIAMVFLSSKIKLNKKYKEKKSDKILPAKSILQNKHLWINALIIGLLYSPTVVLGEIWGTSYLSQVKHISIESAAYLNSIIFVGLFLGCPVVGWLSNYYNNRVKVLRACLVICLLSLLYILYGGEIGIPSNMYVLTLMIFIYGFANSAIVICYAYSSDISTNGNSGLAIAVTNMCSIAFGAFASPLVGLILENFGHPYNVDGVVNYDVFDYNLSFICLPIGIIVALFLTLIMKETLGNKSI